MNGHLNDRLQNARHERHRIAGAPAGIRLSELSAWIDACEERMPLTVPVGVPRRETREPVLINITYSLHVQPWTLNGIVTNLSSSGFCLTTNHDLSEKDSILINCDSSCFRQKGGSPLDQEAGGQFSYGRTYQGLKSRISFRLP